MAAAPPLSRQNWLKKGQVSEGIHDEFFPESLGEGVWGPS